MGWTPEGSVHMCRVYLYMDCLGCAVLFVCLTWLASLFLPSHLSLKTCTCICIYACECVYIHMYSTIIIIIL